MYVNQLSTKIKLSSGLSKLLFRGFGWMKWISEGPGPEETGTPGPQVGTEK